MTTQAIDTAAPPPGRQAGQAPDPGKDRVPPRSWGSDPHSGGAWGKNTFQWPVRVYWEDTDTSVLRHGHITCVVIVYGHATS